MDKTNKKNCCKRFLSRLYFIIESYDDFNYSAPPWTTLCIIFNMLCCLLTLPLILFTYLFNCQNTWLNINNLMIVLMFYFGTIICTSVIFAIIITVHDNKIYKKNEIISWAWFSKSIRRKKNQQIISIGNYCFCTVVFNTIGYQHIYCHIFMFELSTNSFNNATLIE